MRDLIRNILENEVMTTKQAAAYLGKEASTLRHLVREGKIESVKKGHFTVLDVLDVKQLKK